MAGQKSTNSSLKPRPQLALRPVSRIAFVFTFFSFVNHFPTTASFVFTIGLKSYFGQAVGQFSLIIYWTIHRRHLFLSLNALQTRDIQYFSDGPYKAWLEKSPKRYQTHLIWGVGETGWRWGIGLGRGPHPVLGPSSMGSFFHTRSLLTGWSPDQHCRPSGLLWF